MFFAYFKLGPYEILGDRGQRSAAASELRSDLKRDIEGIANCEGDSVARNLCSSDTMLTKGGECTRDVTPAILSRYRQLLGFH
jgi:hypothetical protein